MDSGPGQVPVHGVTESGTTEQLTLSLSVYTLISNTFIRVCVSWIAFTCKYQNA